MSSFMERLLGKSKAAQGLSETPKGLVIRKLADYQPGEQRIPMWDSMTGEKKLVNPATPGEDHEPWPLLGVLLEDAPQSITISTTVVNTAIREGWATGEDENIVHRSGGPPDNPWAVTHTFRQFSRIVFHTVEGDVAYKVVHNPDKYEDTREGEAGMRVDWFYLGEKENG